ncbi:aminotransferase class IV family protein [Sphaerisporangium corydalis]|uniref:Aminotransferase class IV family protein n=1 Tax=Sphaerisporangium corydalis TaxID=1441875 RepID=A0ABV9EAA5_9ACTN|nr:aminotransferase class IV family protein [Sphaerisporangium corydalis]
MERIEINGGPPTVDLLRYLALRNFGHFTAMQVRDRKVRGLALHLERLDAANKELFDQGLDGDLVRGHIRHALADDADASVRVYVFGRDDTGSDLPVPCVLVSVRPPNEPPRDPMSLWPAPYQRPAAHLKHLGGFGQSYFLREAERAGFDEALLVAHDGTVAEGAITNVGFFDGTTVVWPDAPMLSGITMMLVERGLAEMGVPTRRGPVRLADVPSLRSAFLTNSWGVMSVGRIGDVGMTADPELMATLHQAYDSRPWDRI